MDSIEDQEIDHTDVPTLEGSSPSTESILYACAVWAGADAILVADDTGRYLDANPAATQLLGYTREELLRLGIAEVVALGADWAAGEYARYVQTGSWRGELELRRRDGTLVPVEAQATKVMRPDGTPVYLSMLRDISVRREAERVQQAFLAMVTHELKSPLTAILGHAQLLQRRMPVHAPGLDAIVSQSRRLQRLIDDLRDVAQFAAGQPALRPSWVDLAELVRDGAAQTRASAPTHLVQVEAPEEPLVGWWDADRLLQVLQNLLANAVKYAPAGSTIQVTVETERARAVVSVTDQGCGIAPEDLPHVFERFYRTATAIASGAEGHGLGLHICKLLVEAHDGSIWAQSTLGKGTTVAFSLPFTQARTA